MKRRITSALVLALAFAMAANSAQAQLAKSGTFDGVAAWSSYGELTESADGSSSWHGGFKGAFLNKAGSGFLHNAALTCPGAGAGVDGRQFYQGLCVLTDADGDQAMVIWSCEFKADAVCHGDQTFVAGTGKYKGISGEMALEGRFIGETTEGVSSWKGNWQLP